MDAWALHRSPGDYRWAQVELGAPGPGQVRVEVVASALNHLDLWLRRGLPPPPMFPMVPGCDGAGVVAEVGPGVERWAPGQEVVVNPSFACGRCRACLAGRSVHCPAWGIMGEHVWGAHGTSVLVGEANLVAKPPRLSWEEAAAYGLCGVTALRMLQRARLQAGESLLVIGAGGGVACAAIALAARMGATVLTTSRDEGKRERAIVLGASAAYATPAEGSPALDVEADVVLDSNGTPTWATALRALRPGGRLVVCGGTGGAKVELNLARLFFGQYEVIGSTMGTFEDFALLTELVNSGLPVVVDSIYPLDEYPQALQRLESGAQFGKIVLRH